MGELDDPIAYQLLPKSTRGVVDAGLFDFTSNFLEWVAARTVFLNEGTDAFLSSPSCSDGKECQIVVFGAGFDTRSIRYQVGDATCLHVALLLIYYVSLACLCAA